MAPLNSFEIPLSSSFPLWDSCNHSFNKGSPPRGTTLFRQSCLIIAVITIARVVLDATSFIFLELLLREPYDHLSTMPILLKRPPSIDKSYLEVDIMSKDSNVNSENHDTQMRGHDYVLLSFSLECAEAVSQIVSLGIFKLFSFQVLF